MTPRIPWSEGFENGVRTWIACHTDEDLWHSLGRPETHPESARMLDTCLAEIVRQREEHSTAATQIHNRDLRITVLEDRVRQLERDSRNLHSEIAGYLTRLQTADERVAMLETGIRRLAASRSINQENRELAGRLLPSNPTGAPHPFSADEMRDQLPVEAMATVNHWLARGAGVALYQNVDLSHDELGHKKFVSYGHAEATLKTDPPPDRLPDVGGSNLNWRYRLVAVYKGPPLRVEE